MQKWWEKHVDVFQLIVMPIHVHATRERKFSSLENDFRNIFLFLVISASFSFHFQSPAKHWNFNTRNRETSERKEKKVIVLIETKKNNMDFENLWERNWEKKKKKI